MRGLNSCIGPRRTSRKVSSRKFFISADSCFFSWMRLAMDIFAARASFSTSPVDWRLEIESVMCSRAASMSRGDDIGCASMRALRGELGDIKTSGA